jgi:hypothetical protein
LNVSDAGAAVTFPVLPVLAVPFTVRISVNVWSKVPEVPVMVTREFPVAAVLLAVSVSLPLTIAAVTPLGMPEADSVTLPVNPFCAVVVIVLEPLAPCVIVRLLGDADKLKSGAEAGAVAFTVRLTVVVWVKLPDVPVMVTVEFPVAAVLLAVSVSLPLTIAAVTPLGMPEADSVTLPVNPFCAVVVIVLEPLAPCVIVRLLGDADRLKFGAAAGAVAFTVRLTVVVWVKLPDVPVMVTEEVPAAAVLLAVNVNLPLTIEAVTPLGMPEADSVTLPANPFCAVVVIVLEALAPCAIVRLFGDADRLKSATAAAAGFSVDIPVENRLLPPTELVLSPVR